MLGIIAMVVVAIGVVGYALAADAIADRNRPNATVLRVDDEKIRLEYFTQRLQMFVQQSGGPGAVDPATAIPAMTEGLIEEQIYLRFASELEVTAGDDEVREEIAARGGYSVDDPDFDARLQEELTRTGLTQEEHWEMTKALVLRKKLIEHFRNGVPDTLEAVRYRQIFVRDQTEADLIRKQIEEGADFAALAQEKSLDPNTKAAGGEVGWAPRGLLQKGLEDQLFSQEINEVATYPAPEGVYVLQVLERNDNHQLDDERKDLLAQRALRDWAAEKREDMRIDNYLSDPDNARYVFDRVFPDFAGS
jgi:foldase protein PrsA